MAYNEPEKYTFLNQREKQAITLLGIELKEKKFAKLFIQFNELVKKEILPLYQKIIYKSDTTILKSGTTLMLEIDQFFSWIFQEKETIDAKSVDSSESLKIAEVNNCIIDEITIENFYTLKSIHLEELTHKKFIFFLGENGCGKTILLKSLLITLKKNYIDNYASKKTIGIISDMISQNHEFDAFVKFYPEKDSDNDSNFNIKNETLFLKNVYAYGTNRYKTSKTSMGEEYGFLTLFQDDEYLKNTEEWFKKLLLQEFENKKKKQPFLKIQDIEKILAKLLEIEEEKFQINVSSQKVAFLLNEKEFSLDELSEGYRSIISFVIDLIARITENNKSWTQTSDFKAIVLIDELDMFLHPSWEKNICQKLNQWFPEIQFFITTHSPILIDGAHRKVIN